MRQRHLGGGPGRPPGAAGHVGALIRFLPLRSRSQHRRVLAEMVYASERGNDGFRLKKKLCIHQNA